MSDKSDMLDRRYRLIAAHITVMRFYKPEQNWKHLAELVKVNRQRNFGEVKVNKLLLTFGDWYASTDNTQLLQAFDLTD